jgi:23S rRNA pseudouridine2605 synthase
LNRQIRRMFYEVGYEVKRLARVRLGPLRLHDLPRGAWRALTKSELVSLREKPAHSSSSRKIASGGREPTP